MAELQLNLLGLPILAFLCGVGLLLVLWENILFLKKYTMKYSGRKCMMHEISQIFKNVCIIFICVYLCSYVERKRKGERDCKQVEMLIGKSG